MSIGLSKTQEEERKSTVNLSDEPKGNGVPKSVASRSTKLGELLLGVDASVPAASAELDIRQVACDSRKVQPRALFFALHGAKADGNAFIRDAVSRGAIAIASEGAPPAAMPSSVTWIRVREERKALAMNRLWGCHFGAAVFTNLTREHMDYHKTFEEYFAAKRLLFEGTGAGAPETAVINSDDEYGKQLAGLAKNTVTYGLQSGAQITTKKFQLTFSRLAFTAHTPNGKVEVSSQLVGRINVYNILAAIGSAQAVGISNEAIEARIRNLESVSGRFQRIDLGQPFNVIVDYAHTDDALENLIGTARELNSKGRIITLFGCGGEKDRTKRPVMGEVTGRLSELTILSSA